MSRYVSHRFPLVTTADGDGGTVRRAFPTEMLKMLDPFVTFDVIGPDVWGEGGNRGIRPQLLSGVETVTYLFEGYVQHVEAGGTADAFSGGCVRWLDAGAGVIHGERPVPGAPDTTVHGVRLWLALGAEGRKKQPSSFLVDDCPEVRFESAAVRVLSGPVPGEQTVVGGSEHHRLVLQHWEIAAGGSMTLDIDLPEAVGLVVLAGTLYTGELQEATPPDNLLICAGSGALRMSARREPVRLILFSAPPVREPLVRFASVVAGSVEEVDAVIAAANAGAFLPARDDAEAF